MDIKKITLTLILLTTFICGCKKKTNSVNDSGAQTPANYLSSSDYGTLKIEIAYNAGYPPASETINNIKSFLSSHTNKPGGITVVLNEITEAPPARSSMADIMAIEKKYRTVFTSGDILTTFVYLSNSEYEEGQGNYQTLGIEYGPGSIVLFGRTMRTLSGGIGQPPYYILESSVAMHEFGHILGLVNAGSKMVSSHMDGAHAHHCNNKECLMYFAVETSDLVANLLGGSIPALDGNCTNDLRANGGK
ncbi:MAG: hypothetical protein JWO32_3077 [Bacteroidetes bacterium]|nr:hypothetical protein [Bacteroidota bacterium]